MKRPHAMFAALLAFACGLLLTVVPGASAKDGFEATVGDPANPAALGQAISDAYARGARHIIIAPGTYLLGNQGDQITLSHWRNATLSAYHVTLIVNNADGVGSLFRLDGCDSVTVAGPLLSQTLQTAYQGRILSMDTADSRHMSCVWRPSLGYPVPPAGTMEMWINFVDARTRTINTMAGDYYHASLQPLGDGSYRVGLEDRLVAFRVGDYLVSRYGNAPQKVSVANSHNCTIRDVTMMRNGFAPIFEGESGGNHYIRCHWALGPRPVGATEDPVVTNAADGLHSPDCDPGPDIEDCTFDGVFLDDCIAIHGGYHKIISVNGPAIVADNAYAFYIVGESVRISNDHGFYLQANVTALKDDGDGNDTLTLETTTTIPADACLSNPLHDGQGYKIIGCRLGNTRSRGIIVKADNGLIEGNVISHCSLGLRIGPEWPGEADYSRHVLVQGNTLVHNGDGLVVDGAGAKENADITIRGNRFVGNTGHDVSVAWADGVTVARNTFAAPPTRPAGTQPIAPISVRDANNVTLSGNRVVPSDAYGQRPLRVEEDVLGLAQGMAAK